MEENRESKKHKVTKHYSYFCNSECEYFPCHKGIEPEDFNCLFCYCPLYVLGEECGGDFRYTKSGRKDCSECTLPHRRKNYTKVIRKFQEIEGVMRGSSC